MWGHILINERHFGTPINESQAWLTLTNLWEHEWGQGLVKEHFGTPITTKHHACMDFINAQMLV